MTTLATKSRTATRLGAAALTLALAVASVAVYQVALASTERAVEATLSGAAPATAAATLMAASRQAEETISN